MPASLCDKKNGSKAIILIFIAVFLSSAYKVFYGDADKEK